MRLHPAPQACLATVAADVVILDLSTDAYFCLPGAAGEMTPDAGGGWRMPASLGQELILAGLMRPEPSPARPPLPRSPVRTTRDIPTPRPRFADRRDFLISVLKAGRSFPNQTIAGHVEMAGRCRPAPSSPEALVRRATLFDHWMPWVPGQGLCLYRASVLLDFLRRDGLTAQWVFGVRTWPFGAHCWLQCDDLLLDDDLDRVALYTPLLAV